MEIGDLGFSGFVKILKYESSKFGTIVIEVGRFFASSQQCHCCGEKNSLVKNLNIRKWQCPNCGAEHDRDRNAAITNFTGVTPYSKLFALIKANL